MFLHFEVTIMLWNYQSPAFVLVYIHPLPPNKHQQALLSNKYFFVVSLTGKYLPITKQITLHSIIILPKRYYFLDVNIHVMLGDKNWSDNDIDHGMTKSPYDHRFSLYEFNGETTLTIFGTGYVLVGDKTMKLSCATSCVSIYILHRPKHINRLHSQISTSS